MKATVVPAQVTTVEDRIFANLGLSQVLLMLMVIIVCSAIYTLALPTMEGAAYKYFVMGSIALVCGILAIRIKGKIVALWLLVLLAYGLRPRYYVYDKNVTTLREAHATKKEKVVKEKKTKNTDSEKQTTRQRLDIPETARVLAAIENPKANFRLEAGKKGGLRVRLTEIEK